MRKQFVEYFQLLAAPSTSAAKSYGLFSLGCEVNGALLLSVWFDEIWDFASIPPPVAQTFTSTELVALNEFYQFISRATPTLKNCKSFDEISTDLSWKPLIAEANKMLEFLNNNMVEG